MHVTFMYFRHSCTICTMHVTTTKTCMTCIQHACHQNTHITYACKVPVTCMLHASHCELGSLIKWTDRDTTQRTMPFCVWVHYSLCITAIINCFELLLEKLSSLFAKTYTYAWPHTRITIKLNN